MEERYMFDGLFIFQRFDFNSLFEYKNILSK